MRMIHKESGFTILELLASMVIMSFIVLSLGSFLRIGLRGYEGGGRFTEIQENARSGMQMMSADVRKCQTISSVVYDSFILKSLDGTTIRYYVSNHVLYRSINSIANPAAMEVDSFEVREVYPDQINISLTTASQRKYYTLATRVGRRK